jgi:hypothetical protein
LQSVGCWPFLLSLALSQLCEQSGFADGVVSPGVVFTTAAPNAAVASGNVGSAVSCAFRVAKLLCFWSQIRVNLVHCSCQPPYVSACLMHLVAHPKKCLPPILTARPARSPGLPERNDRWVRTRKKKLSWILLLHRHPIWSPSQHMQH